MFIKHGVNTSQKLYQASTIICLVPRLLCFCVYFKCNKEGINLKRPKRIIKIWPLKYFGPGCSLNILNKMNASLLDKNMSLWNRKTSEVFRLLNKPKGLRVKRKWRFWTLNKPSTPRHNLIVPFHTKWNKEKKKKKREKGKYPCCYRKS